MARPSLALALVLCSCVGPPAPDQDLCFDLITRLCLAPLCPDTASVLAVQASTCVNTLMERTHCGQASFTFGAPSRERVLHCREPLVSASSSRTVAPSCNDVSSMLASCPDVTAFLNGVSVSP